jgi:hypothetical protein
LLSMALRKKRLNGGGGANPGCIVCSRCTCAAWASPAHSIGVQGRCCVLSHGHLNWVLERWQRQAWLAADTHALPGPHLCIIRHAWGSKLQHMLSLALAMLPCKGLVTGACKAFGVCRLRERWHEDEEPAQMHGGSVICMSNLPSTAVTVHCPSKCFSMPGLARVNCMVPAALSCICHNNLSHLVPFRIRSRLFCT